jgi:hypothetical protein
MPETYRGHMKSYLRRLVNEKNQHTLDVLEAGLRPQARMSYEEHDSEVTESDDDGEDSTGMRRTRKRPVSASSHQSPDTLVSAPSEVPACSNDELESVHTLDAVAQAGTATSLTGSDHLPSTTLPLSSDSQPVRTSPLSTMITPPIVDPIPQSEDTLITASKTSCDGDGDEDTMLRRRRQCVNGCLHCKTSAENPACRTVHPRRCAMCETPFKPTNAAHPCRTCQVWGHKDCFIGHNCKNATTIPLVHQKSRTTGKRRTGPKTTNTSDTAGPPLNKKVKSSKQPLEPSLDSHHNFQLPSSGSEQPVPSTIESSPTPFSVPDIESQSTPVAMSSSPVVWICPGCSQPAGDGTVSCDQCHQWWHQSSQCGGIHKKIQDGDPWTCPGCLWSCGKCRKPGAGERVNCDTCKEAHHRDCAKKSKRFVCDGCRKREELRCEIISYIVKTWTGSRKELKEMQERFLRWYSGEYNSLAPAIPRLISDYMTGADDIVRRRLQDYLTEWETLLSNTGRPSAEDGL